MLSPGSTVVETAPYRLLFCAHLPPPVDGLAFASRKIADALITAGISIRLLDFSGGNKGGVDYHFRRVMRTARVFFTIMLSSRLSRFVYMPVNAGIGLAYNSAIALISRLRRKRMILHHHSFSYVDSYDRRIAFLLWLAGTDAIHIVLCDCMKDRLARLYKNIGESVGIPSAYYSAGYSGGIQKRRFAPGALVLGHLSNLSLEKGLDDCIALHRALIAQGNSVKFLLGGPCATEEARDVLDKARGEFPDSLVALGLLDEEGKKNFYEEIDVFLFPTRYRVEADPIVISDAQAAGRAVIAIARGCIAERVDAQVGMAVPVGADFVSTVLGELPTAQAFLSFAEQRRSEARARHAALREAAEKEFARLVAAIVEAG